jgi:nucleoside-diphosphate-sugar epimerase
MSDGSSWRPLIHVRDLAAASRAVLEAEKEVIVGEAFNVGSDDQNYLIRDLAELISELTGCEVEFAPDASSDPRSYRVSFAKLTRSFPDLRLKWNARAGASELLAAYRNEGLTLSSFEGRRFVRIRQLRRLLEDGSLTESLRWRD